MDDTLLVNQDGNLTKPSSDEFKHAKDEEAEQQHVIQSLGLLILLLLLILTILTIWIFKKRRLRFIHETGMSIIYGIIAGMIIRFSHGDTNELQETALFDPNIFFYMLLPPIIFAAGYNVQKKHFFRNISVILSYAFLGTIISILLYGSLVYLVVYMNIDDLYDKIDLRDCFQFGALISATDPVTVLAILSELHVDADLYAYVFGESCLNDAVAIVMYSTITSFGSDSSFTIKTFWVLVLDFLTNFIGSLSIGLFICLLTALGSKYTDLGNYPILEVTLMLLMSYSSFLVAEASSLSGIVAILFCGIGQAHYTRCNLSTQGQRQVHEVSELLNFMAENFIFVYLGISLFTFTGQIWKPKFIVCCCFFALVSRAANVFPVSFALNFFSGFRSKKIPLKFQTMMWFAGLRGAIAFALAMKNTSTEGKQVIGTTTLVIVMFTVFVFGGTTTLAMDVMNIKYSKPEDEGGADFHRIEGEAQNSTLFRPADGRVAFWWLKFDRTYMKPVFQRLNPSKVERRHNVTRDYTVDSDASSFSENSFIFDSEFNQDVDFGMANNNREDGVSMTEYGL